LNALKEVMTIETEFIGKTKIGTATGIYGKIARVLRIVFGTRK